MSDRAAWADVLAHFEGAGSLFALDLVGLEPAEPPAGVRARRIGPDEAEAVESAMHATGDYLPGEPRSRLVAGRRGYVVETDGAIAGYGWVATTDEPLGGSGVVFRPTGRDAWLYDFGTVPAFRRRGLYPILLRFVVRDLAAADLGRAWIGTAPDNVVSQRGILRAGFHPVAAVQMRRDGSTPAVDLTPVPDAPPELVAAASRLLVPAG